jgi:predicted lysophospholipase L1 biosynthesis ABC-type transport system permease subunit
MARSTRQCRPGIVVAGSCPLLSRPDGRRRDSHSRLRYVQIVRELDPSVPLSGLATFDDLVDQSLQRPRSISLLVGGFAAVALVLSLVGIYGVMAHYVQQQTKDISIRLALGGRPAHVLGLIVREGMKVVTAGVAVGLAVAAGGARLMSSLLFGVGAADAVTYAAVATLMLGVALAACFVPARRASVSNRPPCCVTNNNSQVSSLKAQGSTLSTCAVRAQVRVTAAKVGPIHRAAMC